MEELANDIQDYLFEYQELYCKGAPNYFIHMNEITLVYNTANARKMFVSVLNSLAILKRIHSKNLKLTDIWLY